MSQATALGARMCYTLLCDSDGYCREAILEFVLADLEKIEAKGIIIEGAAYLLKLMKEL